jgi:transposase-like protein
MGSRCMAIVAHIGDSINEYRVSGPRYFPEACPACGGTQLRRHDHYMHSAGDEAPVPIFRFRCKRRGCCKVFAVVPDLFTPKQSLPAQTQEQAVFQYAATRGTCQQVADLAGVHTSTVWRWVEQATGRVADWTAQVQRWLHTVRPGSYMAADVDESLRTRWYSRRLRLPGKIDRLLLLDRLPTLLTRCREAVQTVQRSVGRPSVTWPTTCLAFCRLVLPGLAGNPGTPAHTEDAKARPRPPW